MIEEVLIAASGEKMARYCGKNYQIRIRGKFIECPLETPVPENFYFRNNFSQLQTGDSPLFTGNIFKDNIH